MLFIYRDPLTPRHLWVNLVDCPKKKSGLVAVPKDGAEKKCFMALMILGFVEIVNTHHKKDAFIRTRLGNKEVLRIQEYMRKHPKELDIPDGDGTIEA
jgi:hypothetical protein